MQATLAEMVVAAAKAAVDSLFDDQGKPYGLASAVNLLYCTFNQQKENDMQEHLAAIALFSTILNAIQRATD